MKTFISIILTCSFFSHSFAQAKPRAKLEGKHVFTIQWLTDKKDKPGTATITKSSDGWYTIKGEQKNAQGYVTISGKVKLENPKKLLFDGIIEYQVNYIGNNNLCKKEGPQIFLSTKNRKYWRMQDMNSCEGGTTDYIDIFF